MENRWNDDEAARFPTALGQRAYTSRLQGADPSLVLHGGGNTSVKVTEPNVFDSDEEILYVKGSGWDLATIEAAGFAPCRMDHLLRLAQLDRLSDTDMARELQVSLKRPGAPAPSVEAILHAILPHQFVDHTHADVIVTLTNTIHGERLVREVFDADEMIVVPYVMPGFKLVRAVAALLETQTTPRTIGLILMNHGIFTFGPTAKMSYDRMIEAVAKAEAFLEARGAGRLGEPKPQESTSRESLRGLPTLRRALSAAAGFPMIVSSHVDEQALSFVRRSDLETISQQGPATPDHVIRTKRLPMLGATAASVASYADAYRTYFADQAAALPGPLTMLDPAPRVALDPELGLITIGRTAGDAAIAEDIYRHTIEVITRAEALGGYRALPTADLFDMEYWDLEQAKLKRQGAPRMFAGEITLVTGAASGIGKACVASLLARGAAVVGIDLDPAICDLHRRRDYLGLACDVTDADAVDRALESAVRTFGGLDMLILNAGVFPAGSPIAQLASAEWSRVLQVNLDANLVLMRLAHPLLKQAPRGGRVVVMGSKNVPAPGPGASAYSASKAALTQLARVAALEWGADGIRVNILHPNAVFDTGIWSEDVLQQRAANYGLTVEQYKTNNVLRVEVTSRDVAELAAEMCGPLFSKTTGAQLPVDGGNERVI